MFSKTMTTTISYIRYLKHVKEVFYITSTQKPSRNGFPLAFGEALSEQMSSAGTLENLAQVLAFLGFVNSVLLQFFGVFRFDMF